MDGVNFDAAASVNPEELRQAAATGVFIHTCINHAYCQQRLASPNEATRAFADYIDSFQSPWVGAFFDLGNHARFGDVATWVRELGPRIVKLDIKGYSNAQADSDGPWKGFVDITAGDIDWPSVRAALREIGFTSWVSAEVGGGDVARLKIVLDQMQQALLN